MERETSFEETVCRAALYSSSGEGICASEPYRFPQAFFDGPPAKTLRPLVANLG